MSESTRAETDGEAAVNAAIDQLLADCPPTETSDALHDSLVAVLAEARP